MANTFELPDLGEGIHEAEIRELLIAEGEEVQEGQALLLVETDKASVEVPSPMSGRVQEIAVQQGDIVNVGDSLMTFGNGEAPAETGEETAAAPAEGGETAQRGGQEPSDGQPDERPVPASPATRRLARQLEVDLRQVEGSGPDGRVTSSDVRAYAEEAPQDGRREPQEPAAAEQEDAREAPEAEKAVSAVELPDFSRWGEVERQPLRSVRRTTAQRMARSWSQIPHVSHEEVADITELDRLRRQYKQELDLQSLSLTLFVMKAALSALREYPRFNASIDLDAQEIILKQYYHMGVAVDTQRGLIVPVVRDVDRKSIRELAVELRDLVQRTRAEEIALEEMQGGTFTLTNVGVIGGTRFAPIINFPQAAILGMARAAWQPVVLEREGERIIETRFLLPLVMSFDHRIVDGAEAARFLGHVVQVLQDPIRLLIEA